ncbi:MAG: DUF4411 family protein [Theionarchaea archaeon]|nr:DUF4411 family protein [Theionarchaea archaeon]
MTSNYYIIDSSSLIELNRHNPMDIYPTVWKKIESLIEKKSLVAPREVLYEIKVGGDQLIDWVRQQKDFFVDPTPQQIILVREILEKYPAIVKSYRRYDADPWIIALAIEKTMNPQETLIHIKKIIITEEKLRGNKIKIPLICREYGIDCIAVLEMFKMEGWTF